MREVRQDIDSFYGVAIDAHPCTEHWDTRCADRGLIQQNLILMTPYTERGGVAGHQGDLCGSIGDDQSRCSSKNDAHRG